MPRVCEPRARRAPCRRPSGSRRSRCPAAAAGSRPARRAAPPVRRGDRVEPERVASERPADDRDVLAELRRDVLDDAVVRGRGRREHRHVRAEERQQPADPPVVRPEVVAPVGDAVGLVDDEQADRALDRRQDPAREALVRQALRARSGGRRSRRGRGVPRSPRHSPTLPELIVAARRPSRAAIAIWLRMSASSGLMISVGPRPSSRRTRVAIQYTRLLPQPVRWTTRAREPSPMTASMASRWPSRNVRVGAEHGLEVVDQRRCVNRQSRLP